MTPFWWPLQNFRVVKMFISHCCIFLTNKDGPIKFCNEFKVSQNEKIWFNSKKIFIKFIVIWIWESPFWGYQLVFLYKYLFYIFFVASLVNNLQSHEKTFGHKNSITENRKLILSIFFGEAKWKRFVTLKFIFGGFLLASLFIDFFSLT